MPGNIIDLFADRVNYTLQNNKNLKFTWLKYNRIINKNKIGITFI